MSSTTQLIAVGFLDLVQFPRLLFIIVQRQELLPLDLELTILILKEMHFSISALDDCMIKSSRSAGLFVDTSARSFSDIPEKAVIEINSRWKLHHEFLCFYRFIENVQTLF